ncbi:MAG: class I SAM-dependent methyltransferase [Acidobacteriaceae bacterium]|nr:class I SAM-dependent methyltransferase [Acidobacteriaceae bacterium]
MSNVVTGFDQLACHYDALWNNTTVGMSQRRAVWRWVDPLFRRGDWIFDLGCGTGEDATHFQKRGVEVYAIDASAEMVRLAQARGVNAHQKTIDCISNMGRKFDGVICNFGVLNCVEQPGSVALALSRLVRSGGKVAICVMGPCCLWEVCYFLWCGKPHKALRRFTEGKAPSSICVDVSYPSNQQWTEAFGQEFSLLNWYGIGLCVPPSYVRKLSDALVLRFSAMDQYIAHLPGLRALADHRLFIFERL